MYILELSWTCFVLDSLPDYHDTKSPPLVNNELPKGDWGYANSGGTDCNDLATGKTCRYVCRVRVYQTSDARLVVNNGLHWFIEGQCNQDTGLCKCMIGNTCSCFSWFPLFNRDLSFTRYSITLKLYCRKRFVNMQKDSKMNFT